MDMFSACNGIIENLYFKFLSSVYKWIKCLFFFFHWFALTKLQSTCNIMSFVSIKYRFFLFYEIFWWHHFKYLVVARLLDDGLQKRTQLTKFFFCQRQLQSGGFHEPLALSDISVYMYASLEVLMKSHLKSVTE